MRLTLRTLLAYLDDTLAASEIRQIGEKVAESDAAQELVARIKQVTRRRRLTAPPSTGPGAFDPNDVAEYLDNVLPSDQLGDIEKHCLESDVHLAEIAACHQILTLILGEPALVPPKARERMYALVKGRESIPYRKATPARKPEEKRDEEALGLSASWLKWVLPVAAVLLLGVLGLAVWTLLPEREPDRRTAVTPKNNEDDSKTDKDKNETPEKDKLKEQPIVPPPTTDKDKPKDKPKDNEKKDDKTKQPNDSGGKQPEVPRRPPPSKEREVAARFLGGYEEVPGVLLARKSNTAGPENWDKILKGKQVYSDDVLMTLPGFANIVQSRTGVSVLMRGRMQQYAIHPQQVPLYESVITLHQSKDVDLDLTLVRGRIYLTNRKDEGPAKIRLRFGEKQVWDITLAEPNNEVVVDLFRFWGPPTSPDSRPFEEEPIAFLNLAMTRGQSTINVNAFDEYTERGGAGKITRFSWTSASRLRGPERLTNPPPIWIKQLPSGEEALPGQVEIIKRIHAALKSLEVRLSDPDKKADIAVKELLGEKDPWARVVAIACLEAMDDVNKLIDVIGDDNETHMLDRQEAVLALERWLKRGLGQSRLLFHQEKDKEPTGLLLTKFKKPSDAKTFFELLFFIAPNTSETFEVLAQALRSPRVEIAELGYKRLLERVGGAVKLQPFNAAGPLEDRRKYAEGILDLIDKKQLPPRFKGKDEK